MVTVANNGLHDIVLIVPAGLGTQFTEEFWKKAEGSLPGYALSTGRYVSDPNRRQVAIVHNLDGIKLNGEQRAVVYTTGNDVRVHSTANPNGEIVLARTPGALAVYVTELYKRMGGD